MNASDFIPELVINRPGYLEKSLIYLGKDIIKVFTGQRRVGKSYMLFQLMNHLMKNIPGSNILFISKELPDFRFIRNDSDLLHYLEDKVSPDKNFLFIDEVQEIEDFITALRYLHARRKWDIWCTGSNASMLSKDVAGMLSGRIMEIHIGSLSYSEFLEFHRIENTGDSLNSFLKYGGLPFLINIPLQDETVREYLKGIYSTILYKDVVSRYGIRNIRFLENLVVFAAGNTGSLLSAKKISDYLRSQGVNMPPNLVLDYLSYLTDAFFLIKVPRSDIQGKKVFEIGEKYYFGDVGLRNMISGFRPEDIGKIIENAVLLHLRANGFQVFTGASGNKEIDFVCQRNQERIYVQVAYLISGQQVREREFGNLLLIKDNYPKYVVSMDTVQWESVEGIRHIRLRDFLSMDL
ncbi:MAG: ATP-binding protein [Bacteroidales bacterium]|nr:ATP-binding protein [Bacteroidales bacterium]